MNFVESIAKFPLEKIFWMITELVELTRKVAVIGTLSYSVTVTVGFEPIDTYDGNLITN